MLWLVVEVHNIRVTSAGQYTIYIYTVFCSSTPNHTLSGLQIKYNYKHIILFRSIIIFLAGEANAHWLHLIRQYRVSSRPPLIAQPHCFSDCFFLLIMRRFFWLFFGIVWFFGLFLVILRAHLLSSCFEPRYFHGKIEN